MAQSYFGSAITAGSTPSPSVDMGFVVLADSFTLQATAVANTDASVTLPPGSQILGITVDTTVASTGATAAASVGSAQGGAQYATVADCKAQGRNAVVYPAAAPAAMADIGSNVNVWARLAQTTPTAVGTLLITVMYAMKR